VLGRLPLRFEENRGQVDIGVDYVSRGPGYAVGLEASGATVWLRQGAIRMRLAGAAHAPRAVPAERLPATSHYFLGSDAARWQHDVPNYGRVRYEQVYPGIDLEYYGRQHQLEYDFIIAPGADPGFIRLDFEGADTAEVTRDGDLVAGVNGDSLHFHKPIAYQRVGTAHRQVEARYLVASKGRIAFEVGDYDPSLPLVIDPILSYSTYFGGGLDETAYGIAVDSSGNTYITGGTYSVNFPTTAGAFDQTYSGNTNASPPAGDVFVVKLNAAGSLVYSTYIGGSHTDKGTAIAVDSAGNAYVTGSTGSTTFPTTAGSFQPQWGNYPFSSLGDAFVLKLNPSGSALVYSSFLSGSSFNEGNGIAVDAAGSAYVTGGATFTFRTTNPLVSQSTAGGSDVFVVKIHPAGSSLVYSRLIGGSNDDVGYGIAIDPGGNAYVSGYTVSSNFAVTSPLQGTYGGGHDAVVARLNSAGAVVYSTYLGGSGLETGGSIAADASGNAYVTGYTSSTNFPVTTGSFQTTLKGTSDAYVAKISPAGSLTYATYVGGSLSENGTLRGIETFGAIAVDTTGNALVVGSTGSKDFPLKEAIQTTNRSSGIATDIFVTRLNAAGSALIFSTYFGGAGNDRAYAVALDASGFAYVAGSTSSADFPTLSPYQAALNAATDLFIAKIDPTPAPTMSLDRTSLSFAAVTTGAAFSSKTGTQTVRLTQSGSGTVTWTASSATPWLLVSPASGTGSATLSVSVQFAAGLAATQTANITLTMTGAANTPGPIAVTLNTITGTAAAAPVGSFDTPTDGATGVAGSIGVTGWAMDDVQVTRVRILRDPVAGETPGVQVYIGDAAFVDGARPDVQTSFPNSPFNSRAGWGYLMLTNFLPGLGNGTFRIHAYADDADGHTTLLGSKTITCSNSASIAPFGAVDTPAQGEVISGSSYNNFGWVLSPGARRADVPGGGSVTVFVDGVNVGAPLGWSARPDLTTLFPAADYSGVANAAAVFPLNTTTLANGVHTIAWIVTATSGGTSGVGSRFFTVSNSSLFADPGRAVAAPAAWNVIGSSAAVTTPGATVDGVPIDRTSFTGRRGFDLEAPLRAYDATGDRFVVDAEELDRIELRLGGEPGEHAGYVRVANDLAGLPIGSTLDLSSGTFTWMPGVAFVGAYDFVFVRAVGGRAIARRDVRIVLHPKGSTSVGTQIAIDIPSAMDGGAATVSRPFVVAGWAADLHSPVGTGVDAVHVWAYPRDGCDLASCEPLFLGAADYGGGRPDVAALYGGRFEKSGYGMTVERLAPGTYDIAVFAYSTAAQRFAPARLVRIVVLSSDDR
jgi:hypothetical protein